jgi:hypothetical protein
MSVSCDCCVLSGRGLLRRADHSSRGVLPSVVCLNVIAKPERGGHDPNTGRSATVGGEKNKQKQKTKPNKKCILPCVKE